MGKHTAYWQRYTKNQVRGTLWILLAAVAWILVIVGLVVAQDALGRLFPGLLMSAFAALVVTIVLLAKDAYKVVCPECGTNYKRKKWGGACPSCGLALLQGDP